MRSRLFVLAALPIAVAVAGSAGAGAGVGLAVRHGDEHEGMGMDMGGGDEHGHELEHEHEHAAATTTTVPVPSGAPTPSPAPAHEPDHHHHKGPVKTTLDDADIHHWHKFPPTYLDADFRLTKDQAIFGEDLDDGWDPETVPSHPRLMVAHVVAMMLAYFGALPVCESALSSLPSSWGALCPASSADLASCADPQPSPSALRATRRTTSPTAPS